MSHNIKEIIKNLSVDCVIFGFENGCMEVLLIRRAINPQKGMWALPGGFIKKEEQVLDAAQRVLKVTTGVDDRYLEEVGFYNCSFCSHQS